MPDSVSEVAERSSDETSALHVVTFGAGALAWACTLWALLSKTMHTEARDLSWPVLAFAATFFALALFYRTRDRSHPGWLVGLMSLTWLVPLALDAYCRHLSPTVISQTASYLVLEIKPHPLLGFLLNVELQVLPVIVLGFWLRQWCLTTDAQHLRRLPAWHMRLLLWSLLPLAAPLIWHFVLGGEPYEQGLFCWTLPFGPNDPIPWQAYLLVAWVYFSLVVYAAAMLFPLYVLIRLGWHFRPSKEGGDRR